MNSNKRSDLFIAFGLINLVFLMLVIPSVFFIFNVSISFWHFPFAFAGALFLNFYIIRNHISQMRIQTFFISTFSIVLIVGFSLVVANLFYDYTWDGQSYHMEAIIKLKEGWNPMKSKISDPNLNSLWINHYAKGAEIPQAVVYAFTERIETGKATNIILLFASFFLCTSFLRKFKLSNFKIYLLSVLFVLNPVVVNQLLSTYVDGQMATLLISLLISASMVFLNSNNKVFLYLLISILIILINLKFTAIAYTGVLISGLLLAILHQRRIKDFFKIFTVAAVASVFAVFIIGFNPYVTNTINFNHPFYPLAGKEKVDILSNNYPLGFQEKNRFEKLAISLFAETGGASIKNKLEPTLKIPFTFNKDEILKSARVDNRVGGFGILFSGIIILSILIFILIIKDRQPYFKSFILVISIILITILLMPESWWARYSPQIYFIPLIILLVAEGYRSRSMICLKNLLYLIIILNIGILGLMTLRKNILVTMAINDQLNKLKEQNQILIVDYDTFRSNRIRFSEKGINTIEKKSKNDPEFTNIVYSETKVKLSSGSVISLTEK